MSEKTEIGIEFQFFEVMGTNVANKVVQHFSNLTSKGCLESANQMPRAKQFFKELLSSAHQSTCRDSIYKIGKDRKRFFNEPASRWRR